MDGGIAFFKDKEIPLRRGNSTANVHMDAINKETIHYFSLLKEVLDTHQMNSCFQQNTSRIC